MLMSMPCARRAGKIPPPMCSTKTAGRSLSTLHLIAHRISDRTGIPFEIARLHAEAAGLGKEVAHG